MAYSVEFGDEFRWSIYCRHRGQESINQVRVRVIQTLVPLSGTDQDLCDQLSSTVAPFMTASFTTETRYEGSTIRRVASIIGGGQPVTKFSILGTAAGTLAPPTLPAQVAGLVSLYTDVGGKKYRGRFYYPFVAQSEQEADSSPDPAFVGTTLGDIGALLTSVVTILHTGVPTFKVHFGLHPAGGDPQQFTYFKAHDAWATQRRRSDFAQLNRSPF